MTRVSKSTNNKPPPNFSKNVVGGQPVRNKLLLALPKNERDIVFPKLEFLPLPVGTILAREGREGSCCTPVNINYTNIVNVSEIHEGCEKSISPSRSRSRSRQPS